MPIFLILLKCPHSVHPKRSTPLSRGVKGGGMGAPSGQLSSQLTLHQNTHYFGTSLRNTPLSTRRRARTAGSTFAAVTAHHDTHLTSHTDGPMGSVGNAGGKPPSSPLSFKTKGSLNGFLCCPPHQLLVECHGKPLSPTSHTMDGGG